MNANDERVSERVIGCAFEVSNRLGAGFFENVYENALAVEFDVQRIDYDKQKRLTVTYRGKTVGAYVADLVIEDCLIVEIKALKSLTSVHEAQLMNYLRATGLPAGLLLNFGRPRVQVKRLVNSHDDHSPV
ncbi:GxxExxY protein [Salinisphaera sp. LB1]|uniref:GxxExxY protein n=1 Tax=Salinisphaera sp. LB1 TaxID=2183911 RepID=UPI000D70620A|nr:GxxExxY protein [Salinisphaera sp. LB1]AWN17617.1 NADH:ubiquinone oxidoreductase subunit 5 (chain L)/Multisubunit Na+/H+ antiporter, MnhA subunit [Salinisphaera sp. LB1]